MTGFEPRSSRIISDRSANCATTTSQFLSFLLFVYSSLLNRQLDNISNTHIISHIPTWVHRYYIISITTFVYIFHNVHFILTFSRYTLLIGTYLLYFYFYSWCFWRKSLWQFRVFLPERSLAALLDLHGREALEDGQAESGEGPARRRQPLHRHPEAGEAAWPDQRVSFLVTEWQRLMDVRFTNFLLKRLYFLSKEIYIGLLLGIVCSPLSPNCRFEQSRNLNKDELIATRHSPLAALYGFGLHLPLIHTRQIVTLKGGGSILAYHPVAAGSILGIPQNVF